MTLLNHRRTDSFLLTYNSDAEWKTYVSVLRGKAQGPATGERSSVKI